MAWHDDDFGDFDSFEDSPIGHARFLFRHGEEKTCERCGAGFRGMPDHGFCDTCADAIEAGF